MSVQLVSRSEDTEYSLKDKLIVGKEMFGQ